MFKLLSVCQGAGRFQLPRGSVLSFFFLGIILLTTADANAVVLQGSLSQTSVRRLALSVKTYGPDFTGTWSSQTRVADSSVEAVPVGTEVSSQIRFARKADGNLAIMWEQNGWTDSCEQLRTVSDHEAIMCRTNQGVGDNAGCIEQSHDYYRQITRNTIMASSYVDVYQDGSYLGRYQTYSTLQRICPIELPSLCHHLVDRHD